MRPQQQNRRMRGRNSGGGGNQNRKGPNPLTRNYESNGPDVKIRGSAQQIAEKYAALARDAQSSGDRVMAENYLQHAEHYNRIIAAAQAQMPIQNTQNIRDDFDDDGDDDRDEFENAGNAAETPVPVINHGAGPQPVIEGTPAEVALNSEPGRGNRDNGGRHRDRRPNGGYNQNGQRNDYGQRGDQNGPRGDQHRRNETPPVQAEAVSAADPAPRPQAENLSPADLAAQAGRNEAGRNEAGRNEAGGNEAAPSENAAETGAPRRPRRPRRTGRPNPDRADGNADGGEANVAAAPAGDGGNETFVAAVES